MEVALRVLSLAIYLIVGSLLAYRWVVSTRGDGSDTRRSISKIAFVIVAWIGVFVLGAFQARISIAYFDPSDFPEDRGLPAEVTYDGVGNNVFALFFGWVLVLICIGIAKVFKPKQAEQDAADQLPAR